MNFIEMLRVAFLAFRGNLVWSDAAPVPTWKKVQPQKRTRKKGDGKKRVYRSSSHG